MKKFLAIFLVIMFSFTGAVLAQEDKKGETPTEETNTENQEELPTEQADPSAQSGEANTGTDPNANNIDLSEIMQQQQEEKNSIMDYVWIGVFFVILLILIISYLKDRE